MKIKLIPENDMERQRFKEVVHTGVNEFFIFGNKTQKDSDGLEDFHDWKGSFRYLLGSLYYFGNLITEENNAKKKQAVPETEMDIKPPQPKPNMFKTVNASDLKVIDTKEIEEKMAQNNEPANNNGNTVQFDEFVPTQPIPDNTSKMDDENN